MEAVGGLAAVWVVVMLGCWAWGIGQGVRDGAEGPRGRGAEDQMDRGWKPDGRGSEVAGVAQAGDGGCGAGGCGEGVREVERRERQVATPLRGVGCGAEVGGEGVRRVGAAVGAVGRAPAAAHHPARGRAGRRW
jgi:hypothetical protein